MKPDLPCVMQYKNPQLITYFCHHHPKYSAGQAEQLLEDLLAWLWLQNHRTEMGKKTLLFGPLLELDELWHAFILHTEDYVAFSMQYFGGYVHHQIEPIGFEHHVQEEELQDFLQDCFLFLTPEWVTRRFAQALE